MMSLPTSGNIIFLSKLLALLTQFLILGAVDAVFTAGFILMESDFHRIWLSISIKDVSNTQQTIWEFSKTSIFMFTTALSKRRGGL